MNVCCFTGRLGREWEVSYSQAGKAVSKNSMALKKYNGESVWVNLVAFADRGENLAKFTRKGSMLSVQCSVDVSEYERDGRKTYYTNFIVDNFSLVEKRQTSQHPNQQQQNYQQQGNYQQPNQPQGQPSFQGQNYNQGRNDSFGGQEQGFNPPPDDD